MKRGGRRPQPRLSLATSGARRVITELKQRLERVAKLSTPLLLAAEPGSGDELCARFLH